MKDETGDLKVIYPAIDGKILIVYLEEKAGSWEVFKVRPGGTVNVKWSSVAEPLGLVERVTDETVQILATLAAALAEA